jgi:hypothetical protein
LAELIFVEGEQVFVYQHLSFIFVCLYMKFKLQHIALWLSVVFAFPIVIQPWHVMNHHSEYFFSDETEHQQHCCTHQIHFENKNLPHQLSQSVEHCPVCEYEFATFSLPQNNWIAKGEPLCSEYSFFSIQKAQNTFNGTNRLLRAPPFLS